MEFKTLNFLAICFTLLVSDIKDSTIILVCKVEVILEYLNADTVHKSYLSFISSNDIMPMDIMRSKKRWSHWIVFPSHAELMQQCVIVQVLSFETTLEVREHFVKGKTSVPGRVFKNSLAVCTVFYYLDPILPTSSFLYSGKTTLPLCELAVWTRCVKRPDFA